MIKKTYTTEAGSTVKTKGKTIEISFDWFEEHNACVDCKPCFDCSDEKFLIWTCNI